MIKRILFASAVSMAALSFNAVAHDEKEGAQPAIAAAAPHAATKAPAHADGELHEHGSSADSVGTMEKTHGGQKAAAASPMADGEVKKVDKDAGKITIKHGPLANLDMPGMTMVFRVKDPAMLKELKAGDKVKFNVEKLNGALTVIAIKSAK